MLIGPAGLRGAMAQLVARLVRNEKVRGSSPLSSTDCKCHLTRGDAPSPYHTHHHVIPTRPPDLCPPCAPNGSDVPVRPCRPTYPGGASRGSSSPPTHAPSRPGR